MRRMMAWRLHWIAAGVAVVHVVSAAILFFGPAGVKATTPMHMLSVAVGSNHHALGALLALAGFAALVPLVIFSRPILVIMLILPQQVILGFHLASALFSIIMGRYPDGYIPDGAGAFIAADQAWLIMTVFWHTMEYAWFVQSDRR